MWQLYAQTAFDLVAERQREARQAAGNRSARPDPAVRWQLTASVRRQAARGLAGIGRWTAAVSAASSALATRLERGPGNA